MVIVGWISVAVGVVAAVGLGVMAGVVRSGARDASDRRLAWGLAAGAVGAAGVPVLGVVLGRHGHTGAAWAVGLSVIGLGVVVVALLPRLLSAAAQP